MSVRHGAMSIVSTRLATGKETSSVMWLMRWQSTKESMTSALTRRSLARTARTFQPVPPGAVPSSRGWAAAVSETVVMMLSRIPSRPNDDSWTSIVEAKFPAAGENSIGGHGAAVPELSRSRSSQQRLRVQASRRLLDEPQHLPRLGRAGDRAAGLARVARQHLDQRAVRRRLPPVGKVERILERSEEH